MHGLGLGFGGVVSCRDWGFGGDEVERSKFCDTVKYSRADNLNKRLSVYERVTLQSVSYFAAARKDIEIPPHLPPCEISI